MAVKEQFNLANQSYQNLLEENRKFTELNQRLKYKIKEREKHLEKIDDILGELQKEKFLYNQQQSKYAETESSLKDINENLNDMLLQRD